MDDAPKSEWERLYTESIRREDELIEPEPWWSATRVRGWLVFAGFVALAVDLAFGAVGVDANWPAVVAFLVVPVAGVAVSVRRHRVRRKRDREVELRRYQDAPPLTGEADTGID